MKFSENQIDIMCNFLANYHDWPIENLEVEFFEYAIDNGINLDKKQSSCLLNKFLEIPGSIRFHREFDHKVFISTILKSDFN